MKILTADQMRGVDQLAEREFGISSETLMDNAGRAVADALMGLYPTLRDMDLLILCGKGNNGGDGIAAARHLKLRGIPARVLLLARASALTGPAAAHRDKSAAAGVTIEEVDDEAAWAKIAATIPKHRIILDALLGTGATGAARGLVALAIQSINESSAQRVSVDIASGLSGNSAEIPGPAVRADHTIALACPKVPHLFGPAEGLAGDLHVADIGIPQAAVLASEATLNLTAEADAASWMPVREADSHKGDFGRVLVVAGSLGKPGAAAMVCQAALRSGAGLVTAATAASAQPILAALLMEAMTEALPETHSGSLSLAAAPFLRDLIHGCDVLAIGPGLTAGQEVQGLVREIVKGASHPIVLDADGINAFAGRSSELRGDDRVLILTPHPGEMARLVSRPGVVVTNAQIQADRVRTARSFAVEHACYLVLKGHHTVIAGPDGEVWVNPTGNPGMATAGSGDVLTGVVAGLLAQGISPMEASLLGVYVHGLAGDLAAADRGEISLMARDVIEYLPEAFLQLERAAG